MIVAKAGHMQLRAKMSGRALKFFYCLKQFGAKFVGIARGGVAQHLPNSIDAKFMMTAARFDEPFRDQHQGSAGTERA